MIDLTDEIAYSTADLDDGVEARILTREQVRASVPVFARLYMEVERRYPAAAEKLKFNEALKRVLDTLVSDLIEQYKGRDRRVGRAVRGRCAEVCAASGRVQSCRG